MLKFTDIGKEYSDGQETAILNKIGSIQWLKLEEMKGKSVGMAQGMAINKLLKEIKGRHTAIVNDHININHDGGDCFGFYGFETHYKNGTAKSYWIDGGCELTCVALDFEQKEGTV